MPKAKARRKGTERGNTTRARGVNVSQSTVASSVMTDITGPAHQTMPTSKRPSPALGTGGVQGLIMPAMVTLGSWGMAVSFSFFSADPNHFVYGGMAALMGLMWSFSFGLRLRKVLQRK